MQFFNEIYFPSIRLLWIETIARIQLAKNQDKIQITVIIYKHPNVQWSDNLANMGTIDRFNEQITCEKKKKTKANRRELADSPSSYKSIHCMHVART